MISFLSKVIVIKNQVVKNKNLSFIYIYINSLFCFNLSLSRQELYSLINTFNRDIQVLNSPLLPVNQITHEYAHAHTHTHIYIYHQELCSGTTMFDLRRSLHVRIFKARLVRVFKKQFSVFLKIIHMGEKMCKNTCNFV